MNGGYYSPDRLTDFFLGLDLAQASQFTALAIVERTTLPPQGYAWHYSCRDLRRWPIGTPYPEILRDLRALMATLAVSGLPPLYGARLVVDGTGVGRSAVDMFRCVPCSDERFARVLITSGHAVTYEPGGWHVPRKELVGVLQATLQTSRLKIAQSLPEAELLAKELLTFRAKITPPGSDLLADWRERDHDDLVLGLAVALWYAERYPPEPPSEGPFVAVPGKEAW